MASIQYGNDLHRCIQSGVRQLTNVVSPNYGPVGRNTILDQKYDLPMIANSGRKLLPDFSLEERFSSIGAELVRDAALQIGAKYGDGSIACVLLAAALLDEGYKRIAAGYNPVLLRKGALLALARAIHTLEEISIPCTEQILKQAASRAAKSEELGALVIQACEAVGANGTIVVQDSQGRESHLRIWDGVRYDYGLWSKTFAESEVTQSTQFQNPRILLANCKIKRIEQIQKILIQAAQTNTPLIMIVEGIEDSVLSILAANIANKAVRLAVAKAPGLGDTRRRNMFALSAKTCAAVFEDNGAMKLEDCGLEVCGIVQNACLDMDATLLQGFPKESTELVLALQNMVKEKLEQTTEPAEIERLQVTDAILTGKNVEIFAGGVTEHEMFEKKYLLENAVKSLQAIDRHGVVPGGGKSFLCAAASLTPWIDTLKEDEKIGAQCLQAALQMPLKNLIDNSGQDGSPVLHHLMNEQNPWSGYDVLTSRYCSLLEQGIVDSTKITTELLRTATETAVSLWTTEAAIL